VSNPGEIHPLQFTLRSSAHNFFFVAADLQHPITHHRLQAQASLQQRRMRWFTLTIMSMVLATAVLATEEPRLRAVSGAISWLTCVYLGTAQLTLSHSCPLFSVVHLYDHLQ
jgi:hypothetical protein